MLNPMQPALLPIAAALGHQVAQVAVAEFVSEVLAFTLPLSCVVSYTKVQKPNADYAFALVPAPYPPQHNFFTASPFLSL
jgi:hypothetical protein